jgi:RNA polymerase sigma-70 factor (ECF subfamily)
VSNPRSDPCGGQEGEPDFARLVELHYGPLHRFALSLTHQDSDAGELVQETFLTWAAKGHQLHDASRTKSWLFTTLHRHFLARHRRATRFPHLELTAAGEELAAVDPECARRLDAQAVLALLARLEPEFRAAVALFYLEDLSYHDIAALLQVPLGTVKSRIARGVARLKAMIAERDRPPDAKGGRSS